MEVEGAGDAERGLVLDAGEARWRAAAAGISYRAWAERSCPWVRATEGAQSKPECHGADDERVDSNREHESPGCESRDHDEGESGRSEDS